MAPASKAAANSQVPSVSTSSRVCRSTVYDFKLIGAHVANDRDTRALVVFLAVAFATSWSGWCVMQYLLAVQSQAAVLTLLFYSGVLVGPSALIAARVMGPAEPRRVIGDALRARAGLAAWALVVGVPVLWIVGSALLFAAQDPKGLGRIDLSGYWAIMSRPAGLINFSYPIFEEIAWRGFLLPTLMRQRSALSSAVIVGLIWAFWHVPFYGAKIIEEPLWFLSFSIGVMCLSLIFAGVYLLSRSVLATIVLHWHINAIQDAAGPLFPDLPPLGGGHDAYALISLLVILVIAVPFAVFLARYQQRSSGEPVFA